MEIKVIGISGKMGAGKTTLAKGLSETLQATGIAWDDFDDLSTGPEDYLDWHERGENYDEWNYQSLANILETLKANQPVWHPSRNHLLQPTEYLVFDAPLGRLHQQTGRYIDFCVHIETPLDVSLARRLMRDFKTPDKSKDALLEELEFYLSHSRKLFFDESLKARTDVIVDGLLSTQEQIQAVLKGCQKFEV